MSFHDLRRAIEGEIFDYQMLMYHLREYKKPRDKITLLLKNQSIIRVKKGMYIFGADFRRKSISQEILANLIYTPSYISLQYALSKYGLIPERAYAVSSISLNRSRTFKTPIGVFTYKIRPLSVYPIGIQRIEIPLEGSYLIAEREKALVDLISVKKKIKNIDEMREYLYEDLRMEKSDLKKLNKSLLKEISAGYQMTSIIISSIYD